MTGRMMSIIGLIVPRANIWSNTKFGRDYVLVPADLQGNAEKFPFAVVLGSINGLYCDEDGKQNRYGQFCKIINWRWPW